jgi:hypothetical protein
MNITKYEHSCIDVRVGASRLIIDPGSFAISLIDLDSIDILVITHIHPDHLDEQKVRDIVTNNPDVRIFSTDEVSKKIKDLSVIVPKLGKNYEIKDIMLEFFGNLHATILPAIPKVQNFGVLVNNELYYTGDSFTPCSKPHNLLAITAYAPWMKISDSADFIHSDSARFVFPSHDGFLNDSGRNLVNGLLKKATELSNKTYLSLSPKDSFESENLN